MRRDRVHLRGDSGQLTSVDRARRRADRATPTTASLPTQRDVQRHRRRRGRRDLRQRPARSRRRPSTAPTRSPTSSTTTACSRAPGALTLDARRRRRAASTDVAIGAVATTIDAQRASASLTSVDDQAAASTPIYSETYGRDDARAGSRRKTETRGDGAATRTCTPTTPPTGCTGHARRRAAGDLQLRRQRQPHAGRPRRASCRSPPTTTRRTG